MKEYIVSASVTTGYYRIVRTRTEIVTEYGSSYSGWTYTYSSVEAATNTKIKCVSTTTRTYVRDTAVGKEYLITETADYYRFDLSFDLTSITAPITSVKLRAKLTDKSGSPLG